MCDKKFKQDEDSWDWFNIKYKDDSDINIYTKVNELLYISPEMNQSNLTNNNVYQEIDFFTIKQNWRTEYDIYDLSIYPLLVQN